MCIFHFHNIHRCNYQWHEEQQQERTKRHNDSLEGIRHDHGFEPSNGSIDDDDHGKHRQAHLIRKPCNCLDQSRAALELRDHLRDEEHHEHTGTSQVT